MKKWLYQTGLILFFVVNINAANTDFFGVREVVAAKGGVQFLKFGGNDAVSTETK